MNNVILFENKDFGKVRTLINNNGEVYFVAKDIAEILGYTKLDAMYRRLDSEEMIKINPQSIEIAGFPHEVGIQLEPNPNVKILTMINESGLYSSVLGSKLPSAMRFQKWVTKEVLPSIRKTGSYIVDNKEAEKQAVSKVLAKADTDMLEMFQALLTRQIATSKQLEVISIENKRLEGEVIYKEDVIIGLVEDISLAEKRQRLNQIMKYGFKGGLEMRNKWGLLYSEFEKKYHIDLSRRMNSDKALAIKPKFKNKVDYIEREMEMIPQLYEIACKLFENDIEVLKNEWVSIIEG